MGPARTPSAILTLTLAAFWGCTQVENPRTVPPGSPAVSETRSRVLARAQLDDVPVPPGFEYVTRANRSFSYLGGGVRVARLEYWGQGRPDDAATFYLDTLPMRAYRWTLASDEKDAGARVLRFTKEQQSCEIRIVDGRDSTSIHVTVLGPTES